LRHVAIAAVVVAALLAPALAYSLAAPGRESASAAAQAPHTGTGTMLEATIRGHRVLVVPADKAPEAAKRLGLRVASAAPGRYLAALARIDTKWGPVTVEYMAPATMGLDRVLEAVGERIAALEPELEKIDPVRFIHLTNKTIRIVSYVQIGDKPPRKVYDAEIPSGPVKVEGSTQLTPLSYIYISTGDDWAPMGRLEACYVIYRMADEDPLHRYYIMTLETRLYPGAWLNVYNGNPLYDRHWELDRVEIYTDLWHDKREMLYLVDYEPGYGLDYYDTLNPPPLSLAVGPGYVSVQLQWSLPGAYRLEVYEAGEGWVRWLLDLNREDYFAYGVGVEPVQLEPGLFIVAREQGWSTLTQPVRTTVWWTYNRPVAPDSHREVSLTHYIYWFNG